MRDPGNFGAVDPYGRELAWLWIGDSPFWFEEEMLPNRDPSGSAASVPPSFDLTPQEGVEQT